MEIQTVTAAGRPALNVMMAAKYEGGTRRAAIRREALAEGFFALSREILQKFTNDGGKCAIYGDFSPDTGKPPRVLIRESSRRSADVLVAADRREAVARLAEI